MEQSGDIINIMRDVIGELKEPLSDNTTILICTHNRITELPKQLPPNLKNLTCYYNYLTKLPEPLPDTLTHLDCFHNHITKLPDKLPKGLIELDCGYNRLTALPDPLPPNLIKFACFFNPLIILPDLPETITMLNVWGCIDMYRANTYPELFCKYKNAPTKKVIEYINTCNGIRRSKERLAIINIGNVLLEHYMKRMMHPSRLAPLIQNSDLDVDNFMCEYVNSL